MGNYPDSRVCIDPHISLQRILLQALLPFLSIVRVQHPDGLLQENHNRETDVGDPTEPGSLRNEFIKDHRQDDSEPQLKSAIRDIKRASTMGGGGGGAMGGGAGGGGAADETRRRLLGGAVLEWVRGLTSELCEAAADRVAFYTIPKVKFSLWFASHVMYTLQLTYLGIFFSEDKQVR